MHNHAIAKVFKRIADLLELAGDSTFRIRSYRSASTSIRNHSEPLEEMHARGESLTQVPGVGKGHAETIQELLETGESAKLKELQENYPEGLPELLDIRGVGPKTLRVLYEELGVESFSDLREAAKTNRIRGLSGMGARSERKLLQALETFELHMGRMDLRRAEEEIARLDEVLQGVDGVERWEVAGSYRRRRETVGDLDVLVVVADDTARRAASDALTHHPRVDEVLGAGEKKVTLRFTGHVHVDVRFIEKGSFGAALLYFTGSKAHNIALRRRAVGQEAKLNEYGLFRGDEKVAGGDEEGIFAALGLRWIPPELRESRGEIEAAEATAAAEAAEATAAAEAADEGEVGKGIEEKEAELPQLVDQTDLRGDLHVHTDASDGRATLEEMVEAAVALGHEYVAITDHSAAVSVANGLDAALLEEHMKRIRALDAQRKDIWVLAGTEVDILENGKLDYPRGLLEQLDWVVASIHSHFHQKKRLTTRRLVRAIESGCVHCLGHPFGRMIGRRPPLDFDVHQVFSACLKHHVCLEVNSSVDRLDLPDIYCRQAAEMGIPLVINTDAHGRDSLSNQRFGVWTARRGWAQAKDVLNTRSAKELREYLRDVSEAREQNGTE
mgnify:CR=1 FL=1